MDVTATAKIREARGLDIFEKSFLYTLASHKEGMYKTHDKNHQDMAMSRPQYFKVRGFLLDNNLIQVTRRFDNSSVYQIDHDGLDAWLEKSPGETPQRVKSSRKSPPETQESPPETAKSPRETQESPPETAKSPRETQESPPDNSKDNLIRQPYKTTYKDNPSASAKAPAQPEDKEKAEQARRVSNSLIGDNQEADVMERTTHQESPPETFEGMTRYERAVWERSKRAAERDAAKAKEPVAAGELEW